MLESLQKYNNLPTEIKNKVSTDDVLDAIEDLEKRYDLSLSNLIIRVMIKDFSFSELSQVLMSEFKIDEVKAATLEAELRTSVFKNVLDYLAPDKDYSPEAVETKIEEPMAIKNDDFAEEKEEKKEEVAPVNLPVASSKQDDSSIEEKITDKSLAHEDDDDISAFHEKVSALPPKTFDLNSTTEEIMQSSGIGFASSELSGRLRNTILTYLKGIRSKAKARESLVKSVLSGGLSLEEAEADRVLAAAEKKKNEGGIPLPLEKKSVFSYGEEQTKKDLSSNIVEYDLAAELKKKTPENTAKKIENDQEKKEPEIKEEIKTEDIPIKENKDITRKPLTVGNKKKMDDIGAPQVMSPIDELAYMDLVVFRRLGDNAQKITTKIKDVIDLLSKSGVDKQVEGVLAWRRSPVNKTYISMGQESISDGKDIDIIIEDRKKNNLNYLTREEFEAITDLNNRLRF